ncbi:MAG TPA: hypothetical protein VGK73_10600 [Polyangiaceae bacterium]
MKQTCAANVGAGAKGVVFIDMAFGSTLKLGEVFDTLFKSDNAKTAESPSKMRLPAVLRSARLRR